MRKLRKALYGLIQAPWAWYGKIAKFLVQSGFIVEPSDLVLFVKNEKNKLTIVLVYANDFIISRNNETEANQIGENETLPWIGVGKDRRTIFGPAKICKRFS